MPYTFRWTSASRRLKLSLAWQVMHGGCEMATPHSGRRTSRSSSGSMQPRKTNSSLSGATTRLRRSISAVTRRFAALPHAAARCAWGGGSKMSSAADHALLAAGRARDAALLCRRWQRLTLVAFTRSLASP